MRSKVLTGLTIGGLSMVAVLAIGQSARATENREGFMTPSKNISCINFETTENGQKTQALRCDIQSELNPMPPKPASCNLDWGKGFWLTTAAKKAEVLCVGDMNYSPNNPILNYGKIWKKDGFSCKSTNDGLTCTNGKGNGFFMNRQRWKAF